jgi:hypothetical protein
MMSELTPDGTRAAERELLHLLCTGAISGAEGEAAIRFLDTYPWGPAGPAWFESSFRQGWPRKASRTLTLRAS